MRFGTHLLVPVLGFIEASIDVLVFMRLNSGKNINLLSEKYVQLIEIIFYGINLCA